MKLLFATICSLILAGALAADEPGSEVHTEDGLARCVGISGSLARLACYDRVAGHQRPTERATGGWVVSQNLNPVDDTKTVLAILQAVEGRSKYGKPIELLVRCQANVIDLFISWGQYLGNDPGYPANQKDLTMRMGGDKAFPARWDISTDGAAAFATTTSKMHLLRKMVAAQGLVVRTTPYGSVPITATFDTTGIAEALAPVMEACGQPPFGPSP